MKHLARQRGTTSVEFAIVGVALMVVLFGIIEMGRIVFTLNMLQEGARRAARVAVTCPYGDTTSIEKAALFTHLNLPGEEPTVLVEYLNQSGGPHGNYDDIAYVRVSLVDYQFKVWIPLLSPSFTAPAFSSTLPRESLGVPKEGAEPGCKAGTPL
jgi:hypothetical protein